IVGRPSRPGPTDRLAGLDGDRVWREGVANDEHDVLGAVAVGRRVGIPTRRIVLPDRHRHAVMLRARLGGEQHRESESDERTTEPGDLHGFSPGPCFVAVSAGLDYTNAAETPHDPGGPGP